MNEKEWNKYKISKLNETKEETKEKELETINVDMVRRLRNIGMHREANKLVYAHLKSLQELKRNITKEQNNIKQKKRRIQLKKQGKCIICGEEKQQTKKAKCNKCLKKSSEYIKKKYRKKKKNDFKVSYKQILKQIK